jgi:hypothetical protein
MGLITAPEELALTYWQYFTLPVVLRRNMSLMESPKVQFIQQMAAKGRETYFREFMAAVDAGLIYAGAFDLSPMKSPHLPGGGEPDTIC